MARLNRAHQLAPTASAVRSIGAQHEEWNRRFFHRKPLVPLYCSMFAGWWSDGGRSTHWTGCGSTSKEERESGKDSHLQILIRSSRRYDRLIGTLGGGSLVRHSLSLPDCPHPLSSPPNHPHPHLDFLPVKTLWRNRGLWMYLESGGSGRYHPPQTSSPSRQNPEAWQQGGGF